MVSEGVHVSTLADLMAVLAPSLHIQGAEAIAVAQVCIDSRQASPGCLFVALRGQHADGHDYVQDAFRAGATVTLVERPIDSATLIDTRGLVTSQTAQSPVAVVVDDSLAALQSLAKARRDAHEGLRVIGVTGSVGKTMAKEAIASVIAQRFVTLKSEGNRNNEIGLPLTLMALDATHQRAVLEMGMYDLGEIALLCEIARPQIGVVTNVGPTHLERLGSLERIAQAKAELVRALPPDGFAVLNGDDERVREMSKLTSARALDFGLSPVSTVWAEVISSEATAGVRFVVHVREDARLGLATVERVLSTGMLGRHAVQTALPAIAIGLLEGLSWDEIEHGLLALGRGIRLVPKPGPRGSTVLDDSYNASPTSTLAALDVLSAMSGRRIAVLGDMLELGVFELEGHLQVGRHVAKTADLLVAVGERAAHYVEGALEQGFPGKSVHAVPDGNAALALLADLIGHGDALLVKGSRGMKMEEVVAGLCAGGEPTGEERGKHA